MTLPENAGQRPPTEDHQSIPTHPGHTQTAVLPPPPEGQQPFANAARRLAIAALVVGIAAALAGWVPILGAVIGVVAIVLAAIALVKKQSKPLAVTGLVLGVLATVTSLVITLTLGALGGNLLNELSDMDESADGSFEVVEPGVVVDPDELEGKDASEIEAEDFVEKEDGDGSLESPLAEPADAPISTASGTEEDPHLMGTRIVDEEWDMVVNSFTLDATDQVLKALPDGRPPGDGTQYALVNATVFYKGEGTGPTRHVDLKYNAPKMFVNAMSDRSSKKAISAPEPNLYLEDLEISDHFTGNAIFEIPATETPGGLNVSFGWGSTTSMYIAIE